MSFGRERLAFADALAPPPQPNDVGGFVGRAFSALFLDGTSAGWVFAAKI